MDCCKLLLETKTIGGHEPFGAQGGNSTQCPICSYATDLSTVNKSPVITEQVDTSWGLAFYKYSLAVRSIRLGGGFPGRCPHPGSQGGSIFPVGPGPPFSLDYQSIAVRLFPRLSISLDRTSVVCRVERD